MAIKTTYLEVNGGLKAVTRCGEVLTEDRDLNKRMTKTLRDANEADKTFRNQVEKVQALYSEKVKAADGSVAGIRIKPHLQYKCNRHIDWVANTDIKLAGKPLTYEEAVKHFKVTPAEAAALMGWFIVRENDEAEEEGFVAPNLDEGFEFKDEGDDDDGYPVGNGMRPSLIVRPELGKDARGRSIEVEEVKAPDTVL
jgi:hypothetical protein